MVAIRSSNITYVNNVASQSVPLPAGAAVNDSCFIFAGSGWNINTPTGWTLVDSETGTNANGAAFSKLLTSADITAGSVTVTFGGSYYGHIVVCMVGAANQRCINFFRDTGGNTTRTLATGAPATSGDLVLWFSYGRINGAITCNRGATLQTAAQANSSAVCTQETLGASGSVTATFSYSTVPLGDYGFVIVLYSAGPPAIDATQAGTFYVTGPPVSGGIEATQAAFFTLTTSVPDLDATQAALIVVWSPEKFYAVPPAIQLPCQTNCLQFFDQRKRA
jgi:hypothetical protein